MVQVLLGEGLPLFPRGFPQRDFELIENKTFYRGLISLKYKRAQQGKEVILILGLQASKYPLADQFSTALSNF